MTARLTPSVARSLHAEVGDVPLVFEADVVEQLRIGEEELIQGRRPRLGVGLRIVHGQLDLELPEIHAAEPFDDRLEQ